jgi:ubiquinone/menaquinone biosynthesis C-methylase UbiE
VIDYQPEESYWAKYIHALHLRALKSIFSPRKTDVFLDYGCGVGRIAQWLAPQVEKVIGVDTSSAMISQAKKRQSQANIIYYHLASPAQALPAHEVDGILAVWVFQHILDLAGFMATLQRLARVMRPKGLLISIDRLCRDNVEGEESDYLSLRSRIEYLQMFSDQGFECLERSSFRTTNQAATLY